MSENKETLKDYLNNAIIDYTKQLYQSQEMYSSIAYQMLDTLIHVKELCEKRNRY